VLAAPFVPVGVTGTKSPLLSRLPDPDWRSRLGAVSQPGQINVFVVVQRY